VHLLLQRSYAHLSPEVHDALSTARLLEPHGLHLKALRDPVRLNGVDVSDVERADVGCGQ
jgi:hypothetical protein